MDRDEGVQRVYFDLTSQAVVDPEIGRIMGEMKSRFRAVLRERLAELARARRDRGAGRRARALGRLGALGA